MLKKHYLQLMQRKLEKLEKIFEPNELSNNSIDDNAFQKYLYGNQRLKKNGNDTNDTSRTNKQSVSFHAGQSEEKPDNLNMSEIIYSDSSNKPGKNAISRKENLNKDQLKGVKTITPSCIREEDIEDEVQKLDKLSLINMGARYELLNANQMLVDLDMSLRVT
jgi:hypothetical protein